jgi:hypothetical protein
MKARNIAIVGTLGLFAVIGWLVLTAPQPPAQPPLPQPNGYDDLLEAGRMLSPLSRRVNDLGTEELASLVEENAAALRLARAGLRKECLVSLEYSISYATNRAPDFTSLKRLASAFHAEGRLAEDQGRYGDAARAYLDTIRFGHECSRGGLIIDMLIGVACRSIGSRGLQGIVDGLPADACLQAVQQLEEMEARAEPASVIAERERAWSRYSFGWRGRIAALMMRQSLQRSQQKIAAKLQAQQQAERTLRLELAERASELHPGAPSKRKADPEAPGALQDRRNEARPTRFACSLTSPAPGGQGYSFRRARLQRQVRTMGMPSDSRPMARFSQTYISNHSSGSRNPAIPLAMIRKEPSASRRPA